jgi:hypothetical protein
MAGASRSAQGCSPGALDLSRKGQGCGLLGFPGATAQIRDSRPATRQLIDSKPLLFLAGAISHLTTIDIPSLKALALDSAQSAKLVFLFLNALNAERSSLHHDCHHFV